MYYYEVKATMPIEGKTATKIITVEAESLISAADIATNYFNDFAEDVTLQSVALKPYTSVLNVSGNEDQERDTKFYHVKVEFESLESKPIKENYLVEAADDQESRNIVLKYYESTSYVIDNLKANTETKIEAFVKLID